MEEERMPILSFVKALLCSIATACISVSVYRCLLAPLAARVLSSNLFHINQTTIISSDSESLVKQEGQRDKDVTLDAERREEELDGGEIINTLPSDDATTEGSKDDHLDSTGNIPSVIMAVAAAEEEAEGGASASSHTEAAPILTVDMMWSPQEIPYHVLASATNNFSEEMMLGKGGFGPVYRGFLTDLAMDVAVKRLSERSQQGLSEYMAEIKIITQVRHRNLVKLIGWCHERSELLLVYELLPNGSLDDHLFKDSNNLQQLDWPVRYKIAVGLANALTYLHDDCDPFVLHRDVKSSNVLLDSKFDAKLADFGLARRFSLDDSSVRVSRAAGTRGYWAPEYALMCKASRRSDIYSFGVVALEIACGKKAILVIEGESDPRLLVEWVWELHGKGSILDAADKRLNGSFDRLQMERLLMVGLWCAQPDTRKRPTSMRQAGNALLFPETTPLPDLPRTAVIWAHPVASMRMQTVQLSSNMPASSPTLSDDLINKSLISPGDGNYRLINTSPKPKAVYVIKPKRWLFNNIPHFTRWMRRSRTRNGDVVLCDSTPGARGGAEQEMETFDDPELKKLAVELSTLRVATDNFSSRNLLRRQLDGFFEVYTGVLPDGELVAVKRYRSNDGELGYWRNQSLLECWRSEVLLHSKLQHPNLVRLLGFCMEGKERLLVYEYASNSSLDKLLFDPAASHQLNWETRYNIIGGIARGLQYLREDSESMIIHGDLAASNILFDADMNSKLSEFGPWAIRPTRLVGTLSPELYSWRELFSSKADVFSFGVLVLEIVTGQRNGAFSDVSTSTDLLTRVWEHWTSGTELEIVDPSLKGQYQSREVLRCVQIGLLCIQEDPAERPTMTSVVLMLSNYSVSLQVPWLPAFVLDWSSSAVQGARVSRRDRFARYSPNEVSITDLDGPQAQGPGADRA